MGYNKGLVKMKVKSRLNDTFIGIVHDITNSEINPRSNALIVQNHNSLMTYEQFYNVVYKSVLEYIPRDNENQLVKVIRMLPRAIKNIQRIEHNRKIVRVQNEILDKYFYTLSDDNIKEKLLELGKSINQLIDNDDLELLEPVLSRFEDRMRSGLLADLEYLSQLLEKNNNKIERRYTL